MNRKKPAKADKPKELWLLKRDDGDDYVMPGLDDHGGPAYLAYPDRAEAKAAARFQRKQYGIDCTPMRVCP